MLDWWLILKQLIRNLIVSVCQWSHFCKFYTHLTKKCSMLHKFNHTLIINLTCNITVCLWVLLECSISLSIYLYCIQHSVCFPVYSGEGSRYSDNSDERAPSVMARAVTVHPDTVRFMYFAWGMCNLLKTSVQNSTVFCWKCCHLSNDI